MEEEPFVDCQFHEKHLMNTFIHQKAVTYKINKLSIKEKIVKMREDDYKLMHIQLKLLRTNTVSSDQV
jgi:hypothetical protein